MASTPRGVTPSPICSPFAQPAFADDRGPPPRTLAFGARCPTFSRAEQRRHKFACATVASLCDPGVVTVEHDASTLTSRNVIAYRSCHYRTVLRALHTATMHALLHTLKHTISYTLKLLALVPFPTL